MLVCHVIALIRVVRIGHLSLICLSYMYGFALDSFCLGDVQRCVLLCQLRRRAVGQQILTLRILMLDAQIFEWKDEKWSVISCGPDDYAAVDSACCF